MAIDYTQHIKIINMALSNLVREEFTSINVVNKYEFDFATFAKNSEYIRFHYLNDYFISRNTDGETRAFTFDLSIYFDRLKFNRRKEFENLYSDRVDRMTKLLSQNPTYTTEYYYWHDLKIQEREYVEFTPEDLKNKHIAEFKFTIELIRTTMWNNPGVYGYSMYSQPIYS